MRLLLHNPAAAAYTRRMHQGALVCPEKTTDFCGWCLGGIAGVQMERQHKTHRNDRAGLEEARTCGARQRHFRGRSGPH